MSEPLDAITAKAVDAPSAEELAAATDEALRVLWLYGRQDASRAARREIHRRRPKRYRSEYERWQEEAMEQARRREEATEQRRQTVIRQHRQERAEDAGDD